MPERAFKSKWEKRIAELGLEGNVSNNEAVMQMLHSALHKQMLWRYNQIIGFISVGVRGDDIVFDLFKPAGKRVRFDSSKKPYMENLMLNGTHFKIGENDNAALTLEIESWVTFIIEEHIKRPAYADTELFYATLDCIDIRRLIEARRAENREEALNV